MSNRNTTIAFGGDATLMRRLSAMKPREFAAVEATVHEADAAFVNLEFSCPQEPIYPSPAFHGIRPIAPPAVLDELKLAGFNLFSLANNHTVDFGIKGLTDMIDLLKARDMVFAGAGLTLDPREMPGYLDTKGARIGLVAATVSNARLAAALNPRGLDAGRPGLNPLRYTNNYYLDDDRFETLKDILESLQLHRVQIAGQPGEGAVPLPGGPYPDRNIHRASAPAGSLLFESAVFQRGDSPRMGVEVEEEDFESVCRWIREARRQADIVVMSIHCHEGQGGGWNTEDVPEFLVEIAHGCIEAGADIVVGHGPHRLRPIEIFRGKPILYSLGNVFAMGDVRSYIADDMFKHLGLGPTATPSDAVETRFLGAHDPRGRFSTRESVLTVCRFSENEVESVEVHPILLGGDDIPRTERGFPRFAKGGAGVDLLERFSQMCVSFGTRVDIEDPSTQGHAFGRVNVAAAETGAGPGSA